MDALLFCPSCGVFRDITQTSGDLVECHFCGFNTTLQALTSRQQKKVQFVSIERSDLLLRLYGQSNKGAEEEAVIDEECPKCSHNQLSFHTAQLRGVDEGQTIFFTCLNAECRHKFSVHS